MPEHNPIEAVKQLGQQLALTLDGTGLGFALLVFDYGPAGTTAYASNADRVGVIEALEQLVRDLKGAG